MVDTDTRAPDRTPRSAALWAAAVAVPVAVLVGVVMYFQVLHQGEPAAAPHPAVTTAVPVPSTPVTMAAPALNAAAGTVCLAVTSQLPTRLRDLPQRKVSAGPEQNAAYGEPPVTVACGVPAPVMCPTVDGGPNCVPLTADVLLMNGVCWYGAPGPATHTFTTLDREVAVQVSVPASYQQPAQWANEFSDIVVKTDKSRTTGVPSGCRR